MADSGIENRVNEEQLRNSLTDERLKDFKNFKLVGKQWRSHHTVFDRVMLCLKGGEEVGVVVKQFVYPKRVGDPFYSLIHDPFFLYTKEKTNLKLISEISSKDKIDHPFEVQLVPVMYGYHDGLRMILTEDLGKPNMNKHLLSKEKKQREELFEKGIKIIGRFGGVCNRYQSELDAGGDYKERINSQEKYMLAIQAENLLRLYYLIHPECRDKVKEYDSGEVRRFLEEKGSNLESKLKDISIRRKEGLQEELKLQHNDCNGINIVKGRLIDMEDFGYSSWTSDISSYCIIVGLGNNALLRDDQFAHCRHLFLAYEQICRYPESSSVSRRKISKLDNGDLSRFIREEVFKNNEQRYADWTFSFFANAIDKNIQLAATFGRYDDLKSDNGTVNALDTGILAYIAELFSTVAKIDDKIFMCSNPKGVREFFCAYGNLLLDLGIYPENSREKPQLENSITSIDRGVIADSVKKYWVFSPISSSSALSSLPAPSAPGDIPEKA
ncbi:hypothetical protein HZC30_05340 [Candidatus Woesearchaeota archaeon]|nr:hypothetical protein [Candidatus Woesearchaeota archaeon]